MQAGCRRCGNCMAKMNVKLSDGGKITDVAAEDKDTILRILNRCGITGVESPCGGKGTCRKCLVRIRRHADAEAEQVLSCMTNAEEGMTIYAEKPSAMEILESSDLSGIQRDLPVEAGGPAYGFAVDIGTTTVVTVLFDLESGEKLGAEAARNAQKAYGADVISRIQFTNENGMERMVAAIRNQVASMAETLLLRNGVDAGAVLRYSVAGNTVMEHYFAGLDPRGIGTSPFTPASLFGTSVPALSLGLPGPQAEVYLLPAVSGYVGGDITAGILASGMHEDSGLSVLLDIGTNGEIAIGRQGHIFCCATAAGPAFEGAEIAQGMPGVSGAVNTVSMAEDGFVITTIDGQDPVGICGSGMIDALCVMLNNGFVDETGRIADPEDLPESLRKWIGEVEGAPAVFLNFHPDIFLTQKDIRQLQLAKAAIAAGLDTLMKTQNIRCGDIRSLFLAGGFGSKADSRSIAGIGLIPAELEDKVIVIGNSSSQGAAIALFSGAARKELAGIRDMCEYIELSGNAFFNDSYIENMLFSGGRDA